MIEPRSRITNDNIALLTDLYQLKMLQAYWRRDMREPAVFSLFCRRLPDARNYLLACGLDDALDYLETLRFSTTATDYLSTLPDLSADFLRWLRGFRFSGDVYAVPEGTPVFADEPILEVVAPIAEAQIVETYVMNQVHLQTVVASKAARVVAAAAGRAVVDFGLRRVHGTDAGLKCARAFHIAGLAGTSNVLAGHVYGMPVSGTVAHSFIQAFESESEAFRAFLKIYPDAVLLVDTYDTVKGVEKVISLAAELGSEFRARAIRLDSGDLGALAFRARAMLDAVGLERVDIFASGGLDEYKIADLVRVGAPIDGFGVGTGMGVSSDAPALDLAYKLTEYAGKGRLKTSPGKPILPGRKQLFRLDQSGQPVRDVIAGSDERLPGRPLLRQVMRNGERLPAGHEPLDAARDRARDEIGSLPDRIRALEPADPPYQVDVSPALTRAQHELITAVARQ